MEQSESDCWLVTGDACPGCASTNIQVRGKLACLAYVFGSDVLEIPEDGIDIADCLDCRISFKSRLPTPDYLTYVFDRQSGDLWNDSYGFIDETAFINTFMPLHGADLLDIGPGNGQLLKACADGTGRRSALDLYRHAGLDEALKGEFILGMLDQPNLQWSNDRYDIITLFDVLEHLYNPDVAFSNLQKMLKPGGIALIQTGDSACHWAQEKGVNNWWYACRFEHHVFWNEAAISRYADRHDFEILDVQHIKAKAWKGNSLKFKTVQLAAFVASRVVPKLYNAVLIRKRKLSNVTPAAPFMKDHISVVLRKKQ